MQRQKEEIHQRWIDSLRSRPAINCWSLRSGFVVLFMLAAGCQAETLFQSNFDATPVGQPPSQTQQVGTLNIMPPPGNIVVVAPPVVPSGMWVQITRPNDPKIVAGMQANVSQFRGNGTYTFSTFLYIPSGTNNVATIQFEKFGQTISDLSSFLHLDFRPNNQVRIDDDANTDFGTFPRNQAFIVQVTLNINDSPTAHIVLSGAGASGVKDYNIIAALRPNAQQFGAARLWMGFPWTGSFDATNIVITRNSQ